MTRYIAPNNKQVSISEYARYYNQVILSGTDESYPVANGIFFIEYIEAESGTTVIIKDGKGNTVISGISSFDQENSPIRCDYGIEISGNLVMLKGYFVPGIFYEADIV